MSFVDSIKQDNGKTGNDRCGMPHNAYQQLMYPVTGISISVTRNIYVTGIQEDTCNNNPCNMKGDPHDKNIKIINTCIPVNTCNCDV